jgi:hypothetical protein
LLGNGGPPAVGCVVSKRSIFPVNRGARWPLPHVSQEVGKGFSPPVAYKNPLQAIRLVLWMRHSVAPGHHVLVGAVGWALRVLGGVSVLFSHIQALACKELIIGTKQRRRWDKARVLGVMVSLPGLTTRRGVERDLCLA